MRARNAWWIASVLVAALSSSALVARADDASPSIEREGRGRVYGVGAAFLLGATPLTNVEAPDQPALQPGWAVHGRFGLELPPGIAISLVAGGGALGSAVGPVPLILRVLADVRWTLDAGPVRPFASVAAGFLLLKAGPNLRATFTLQGAIGLDIPIEPWVAVEVSLGVEAIMPGDAIREVMVLAMLPTVGMGFRY